jgi:hypothetical protein
LRRRTLETGASKGGPEILHLIHPLIRNRSAPVGSRANGIVDILEIPVVDDRHEHTQAVELARPAEWTATPLPIAKRLLIGQLSFQPDVVHGAIGPNQLSPPVHILWHPLDPNLRQKVVLVCGIADGPDQATGDGFGASLRTEFDSPFRSGVVPDDELGIRAGKVLFDEREHRSARLVPLSAWTVEEIPAANVLRFPPEHGGRA